MPFCLSEFWAQKALATIPDPKADYLPLDGEGIGPDSRQRVHLVVSGMTQQGLSLALNAAHIMHYPNFREGDFRTYSRITFIDPEAKRLGETFRSRYQALFHLCRWKAGDAWIDPLADATSTSPYRYLGPKNFMDIEWEFIEGEADAPHVLDHLRTCCADRSELTTIALCSDDSARNLAVAMIFDETIYRGAHTILVRQEENGIAVNMWRSLPFHDRFRAFGMMRDGYGQSLLTDRYGKLVNALYCKGYEILDQIKEAAAAGRPDDVAALEAQADACLTDQAYVEDCWTKCEVWDRWSSNYSANMLFVKLRFLGFQGGIPTSKDAIAELMKQPEVADWIQKTEHNRWVLEKLLLGFTPLMEEEQQMVPKGEGELVAKERKRIKKEFQLSQWKHLDICSNEMLVEVDPGVEELDRWVNKQLWALYQAAVAERDGEEVQQTINRKVWEVVEKEAHRYSLMVSHYD